MATVVSNPPLVYTALRSLEYTFNMPSIGVDPIEKHLLYRLRNVTDNVYLTEYKTYRPVVDGQDIKIDFWKDLEGITETPVPPLGLPNIVIATTGPIKTIEVEYGEREIDKSNDCEVTDTVEGTTDRVDALGGIWRPWESQFPITGFLLTNRPKRYETHLDSADWIYVAGSYNINVVYYDASGIFNGSNSWTITETFPNSVISIVPIGFQIAPSGTFTIKVYAKQTGIPSVLTDHLCTIVGRAPGCEETALYDMYFVNHKGGVDLMSFDCVDTKTMSISKQYRTERYDKNATSPIHRGQIKTAGNNSFPTINFKKQFDRLIFKETEWLDSFLESPRVWVKQKLQTGSDYLIPGNLVDGSYQTYGDEIELNAGFQYSEERVNPL